jgi:hypothetical protein
VAAFAVALAGVACGREDERTYDADDVRAAFRQQGYVLSLVPLPAGSAAAQEGVVLKPAGGAAFRVYVGTDRGAEEAWPDYVRLKSSSLRRANVLVTGHGGELNARNRSIAQAALEALPDRGEPVEAGDR